MRWFTLVALGTFGCASTGRVAALERRLETLETLLAELGVSPEESEARNAMEVAQAALDASDFDTARTIALDVRARFPNTQAAEQAVEVIAATAPIGKPAPWAVERWLQGSYEPSAKKVSCYVYFEAWCPHCRRYVPELQTRFAALGSEQLGLVGLTRLSRGTTDDAMRAFLSENALTFPVAVDPGTMFEGLALDGVPAVAVVRDGVLIWKGHPARLDDDQIRSWIAGN